MFDALSSGFKKAAEKFSGKTNLSEDNIASALADIRVSLLDADVEYGVTKTFLERVKDKALGQDVKLKAGAQGQKMRVTAGDHFVRICKEELENLMGEGETEFKLPSRMASIMMVGLQGTGKTTTTGKLANFLKQRRKRKPLLVAADMARPAAVEQLQVLGKRLGIPVFNIPGASPVEICKKAKHHAEEQGCDVILFDTAGRLTIDTALMQELRDIKTHTQPDRILLVCDAMMGQDAVTTAKSFNDQLDIDGFIMTKLDGDARGGAALSIKEVTGKPINFLGVGEALDKLEEFRPEGLASRILGMGDIVGLMEDFERVADGDREEDAMRMLKGQFNLTDFYQQIQTIQKMGSLKDLIAKLPMQNLIPKEANIDDRELVKIKAMIDSMTPKERLDPDRIDGSRVKRIAGGSGRSTQEVNELLKKFFGMRKMMGKFGKNMGGLMGKLPGAGSLGQLNKMRQMAGAGAGGMNPMEMMGGAGLGGFAEPRKIDRDKIKKARKAAKNSRKRNRRR